MEISVKELISMVKVVIQGRVLPQESLAGVTEGCAKLYGANEHEVPQLIKEVECEVTFQLELGTPIK